MGSLFGTVFSTLFLNIEMVAKIAPNGLQLDKGLPLSWYPPSPSRTLPLSTSPKGYPKDLQGPPDAFRNIYIYIPESVDQTLKVDAGSPLGEVERGRVREGEGR